MELYLINGVDRAFAEKGYLQTMQTTSTTVLKYNTTSDIYSFIIVVNYITLYLLSSIISMIRPLHNLLSSKFIVHESVLCNFYVIIIILSGFCQLWQEDEFKWNVYCQLPLELWPNF